MYGVFAVRIVEGGNGLADLAPTRPPNGHTEFSWPATGGSGAIPAGHTEFSWGATGGGEGGTGAGATPRREAWGGGDEESLDLEEQQRVDVYCGNPTVATIRARVHLYTRRYDLMGGGAPPPSGPATPSPRGVAGGGSAGGGRGADGEPKPTWRSISTPEPEASSAAFTDPSSSVRFYTSMKILMIENQDSSLETK